MRVSSVNDAPLVTSINPNATYIEDGDAAIVDDAIAIDDVDSTWASLAPEMVGGATTSFFDLMLWAKRVGCGTSATPRQHKERKGKEKPKTDPADEADDAEEVIGAKKASEEGAPALSFVSLAWWCSY